MRRRSTSPTRARACGTATRGWRAWHCGTAPPREKTYAALRNGPLYGRCVYQCDNDVVDHQQTNLLFADGATMSFTMCAFTENCYRYFKAMGTKGEIEADMRSNEIHIRVFGEAEGGLDVASSRTTSGPRRRGQRHRAGFSRDADRGARGDRAARRRSKTRLKATSSRARGGAVAARGRQGHRYSRVPRRTKRNKRKGCNPCGRQRFFHFVFGIVDCSQRKISSEAFFDCGDGPHCIRGADNWNDLSARQVCIFKGAERVFFPLCFIGGRRPLQSAARISA